MGSRVRRHRLVAVGSLGAVVSMTVLLASGPPVASAPPARPAAAVAIAATVRQVMAADHLRAVIVRVTKGTTVLANRAVGESMTGVPATTAMHFRNGAVAFAYISTLLMEYVDEHKVTLDETVDHWLPTLPAAHTVTLKMLANQTTGYADFETDPAFIAAYNADPFHLFTYQERMDYAFSRPAEFAPGTNWSYSHTNFMILGRILSMVGKKPLATLLRQKVLLPMGLTGTAADQTAYIPAPVLHAYSSERRAALGIAPGTPFTEESTYWNPAWGTPVGAAETTDITDLARTAVAVGTGSLLSRSSFHAMTDPNLLGFGHKLAVCGGSCFTQVEGYNYGLGVVRSGSWLLQNPLLSGYSATEAYLPSQKISVAVAATFDPGAFDASGGYPNASDMLFRLIAADVAPSDAPPLPKR